MDLPEPYRINVPDSDLEALQQRLNLFKFPSQLGEEDEWQFGVPVREMSRLVEYWRNGFDWRKQEATLNKLPHFTTDIDVDGFGTLEIHFVHRRSTVPSAVPLLFSHGWPGSFVEVTKLLEELGDQSDRPAFDIVAPSLPNFGFSSEVRKGGFGLPQYAETLHKLMLKLGYNQYVTQGGDWGYSVTRALGAIYPEHVKASHLNLILSRPPEWVSSPLQAFWHAVTPYNEREKAGMARSEWFDRDSYGYNLLQSTKPQTIGFALADSAIGLLAWIYEKLHDWTDQYPWTDDEILTWVSLYWFSKGGPASSVRIYYEATHPSSELNMSTQSLMRQWTPGVLLGIAHFPREITVVPNAWSRTLGPVCYESEHQRGGHFAAWEQPKAIAGDLVAMFRRGGPCYGIVPGRKGYIGNA